MVLGQVGDGGPDFAGYIAWDRRVEGCAFAAVDVVESALGHGGDDGRIVIAAAVAEAQIFEGKDCVLDALGLCVVAGALGVVDGVRGLGIGDGDAGGVALGAELGGACAAVADAPDDQAVVADGVNERVLRRLRRCRL